MSEEKKLPPIDRHCRYCKKWIGDYETIHFGGKKNGPHLVWHVECDPKEAAKREEDKAVQTAYASISERKPARGRKRKQEQTEDTPSVVAPKRIKTAKAVTSAEDYIAVAVFQPRQLAYEMVIINRINLTECLREIIGYDPRPIDHKDASYSRFAAYGCDEQVNYIPALNVVAGETLRRLGFRDRTDDPGVQYGTIVILKRDERGKPLAMTAIDEGIIRRAHERAIQEISQ